MDSYPSWIHRVSELLEMLALLDTDRIDRRLVERLFDLRNTAAKDLLRRMGAQLVGNSFVISRGLLMARLREAAEHPQWSFEINRRQRTSSRIAEMRREHAGRAKVPITEWQRQALDLQTVTGLPDSIQIHPGFLSISSVDMNDLMQQLMQLIKAIDNEYDAIRARVEASAQGSGTNRHLCGDSTR